jgi:methyl-accepting chemotaxis protein WspA
MSKVSAFNSLSGRFLLLGALPALLAIGTIVVLGAVEEYRDLRRVEETVLATSARGAAAELRVRNDRWNNVVTVMSLAQSNGLFGRRKDSLDYLRSIVTTLPLIIGTYYAYEPDADGQDAAALKAGDVPREAMDASGRFLPYWYLESGAVGLKPNTGMETLEYYLGPRNEFARTGKAGPFITEPYVYEGVEMVSHTCPIAVQGRFAGIAGLDRGIGTLAEIAGDIKAQAGADVFVLSAGGRFIAATAEGVDASGALRMGEISRSPYAAVASRWLSASGAGAVFEATDPVLGEPCIYATAPVATGGWTVVVRRTRAEVMAAADAAVVRNLVIGSVGLAFVAVLLLVPTRIVGRRVRSAAEAADRIARGDLTERVMDCASRDETGVLIRSMSSMDRNLNSLVGSVKQASIHLNSTATEIAATSKQQEASAATFGAASSQIAAAVKEISATSQDLGRTMESVTRMAAETADLAGAGRSGLQGMESVMRDLDRATVAVAERLGAINERSQKITSVITTITKVADQTNILSINAAIEAEKAGEYGAGFLVIAREIRRLADQTASATLDIEQIVQQMQAAVSAGVMEMDRFADQVRRGVRDVASAGTQLTEIIDRVNRSTESFTQVNESMQAQSEGARQISDAMSSLVANANQTMQSVREFGKAAADLQSAIGLLRQAVSQFRLKE